MRKYILLLCASLAVIIALSSITVGIKMFNGERERRIRHIRTTEIGSVFANVQLPEAKTYWDKNKNKINNNISRYFCWDRESRAVIIPPECDNLSGSLEGELTRNADTTRSSPKSYLITQDDLIRLSIQNLVKDSYHFTNWVKSLLRHDEDQIDFYIFELADEGNLLTYYHPYDSPILWPASEIIDKGKGSNCISHWKDCFKKIITSPIGKDDRMIKIRFRGYIGKTPMGDLTSGTVPEIYFSNGVRPTIRKCRRDTIEFEIDIYSDIELLKSEGILSNVEVTSSITRIIDTTLYSEIIARYGSCDIKPEGRTFTLINCKTSNFRSGSCFLTKDMEENELRPMLDLIKEVAASANSGGSTTILLTGYADERGKKELGESCWLEENDSLSLGRAEVVYNWLKSQELTANIKIRSPKRCSKKYYKNKNRYVEIKVR